MLIKYSTPHFKGVKHHYTERNRPWIKGQQYTPPWSKLPICRTFAPLVLWKHFPFYIRRNNRDDFIKLIEFSCKFIVENTIRIIRTSKTDSIFQISKFSFSSVLKQQISGNKWKILWHETALMTPLLGGKHLCVGILDFNEVWKSFRKHCWAAWALWHFSIEELWFELFFAKFCNFIFQFLTMIMTQCSESW